MAGRIKASDIEEVKSRTNLADIVGDYVTLKRAGVDSMKGLCPFHDERSPSFHVRPGLGYFHCFGCGEKGDVFTFLQRMDHLTFTETVERLAARINYVLTYEEGGRVREDGPNRARLLAANQTAAAFFVSQLQSEEGAAGREFLSGRGFDPEAWDRFGVGYAPRSWDALTGHLTGQGFSRQELAQAGLVSEGRRGVYDRFRGRVVWPIRDTSGQTLGFGARRLYDDDQGPKYLNTPESPVYHKSQVLYGLDLAKRAISRGHRAVVVEGYTDVMACHLAGVEAAVATCGTAFGQDHIAVMRRIMGDSAAAEVVFTFDPDEAGQKAALRAFSEEKRFSAQTYVAVAPDGLDPCDLRLHRGDDAVQEMFTRKVPLFEFALRQSLSQFDLNTVEGRVSALRQAAPIVAGIKDPSLRPGYTRELARMLGSDLPEVQQAVRTAGSAGGPGGRAGGAGAGGARGGGPQRSASRGTQRSAPVREDPPGTAWGEEDPWADPWAGANRSAGADASDDRALGGQPPQRRVGLHTLSNAPTTRLERDALMAMLQQSEAVGGELMAQAVTAQVHDADLRVIRDAVAAALIDAAGSAEASGAAGGRSWLERVLAATPESHQDLARELVMATIPQRRPEQIAAYARDVVVSLLDRDLLALKGELVARMQRIGDHTDPGSRRIQEQLVLLETARRGLREGQA